jgi:peptidoglycan DL-endopeptidase CwlO
MSSRLSRAPARMFTAFLVAVAASTALVTGTAGPSTRPASATISSSAATALRYAYAQQGDPYRWGAAGPYSFDCSGLTMAAYRAAGIFLPHSSRMQYWSGWKIRRGYWAPGDLIFWASNTHYSSTIYHVAMYIGGGRVIEAPRPGLRVRIAPIWNYSHTMYYAVRPHR